MKTYLLSEQQNKKNQFDASKEFIIFEALIDDIKKTDVLIKVVSKNVHAELRAYEKARAEAFKDAVKLTQQKLKKEDVSEAEVYVNIKFKTNKKYNNLFTSCSNAKREVEHVIAEYRRTLIQMRKEAKKVKEELSKEDENLFELLTEKSRRIRKNRIKTNTIKRSKSA